MPFLGDMLVPWRVVKTPPPISSQILQKNLLTTDRVWKNSNPISSQRPKVPEVFQGPFPKQSILVPLFYRGFIKMWPFFLGGGLQTMQMYGHVLDISSLNTALFQVNVLYVLYNDPLFKRRFTSTKVMSRLSWDLPKFWELSEQWRKTLLV